MRDTSDEVMKSVIEAAMAVLSHEISGQVGRLDVLDADDANGWIVMRLGLHARTYATVRFRCPNADALTFMRAEFVGKRVADIVAIPMPSGWGFIWTLFRAGDSADNPLKTQSFSTMPGERTPDADWDFTVRTCLTTLLVGRDIQPHVWCEIEEDNAEVLRDA